MVDVGGVDVGGIDVGGIDLIGGDVRVLLDPRGGRLGCARARGPVAVTSNTAAAWVVAESGSGLVALDDVGIDVRGRADVFRESGWSALIAPGSTLRLEDEFATTIVWRPIDGFSLDTRVIDAADVVDERRGEGVTTRRVRTYVATGPLIVGETINPAGGWSSWPPHSHPHEELYLYRFSPEHGFGVHVDLAGVPTTVRDGDVVRIRHGEHPVVAAPAAEMYYLWALAGDEPEVTTTVAARWG